MPGIVCNPWVLLLFLPTDCSANGDGRIFSPVELMSKDRDGQVIPYYAEKMLWSDGSFAMDLPVERLKEIFNGV